MHHLSLSFSGGRRSRIRVGAGALDLLEEVCWPGLVALVGDAAVMEIHGARVAAILSAKAERVIVVTFPPGEANKTRRTKASLEDQLLAQGLDRRGWVVGLGGGISLDMAGFVAATYMRSVPWVAVPTSLLAQVDASVGGKTGVNTSAGKNLVGAFHQPEEVFIDPDLLSTLPPAEWGNGLAELVKHGVVADRELFGALERDAARLTSPEGVDEAVLARAVGVKVDVVGQDEREAGLRSVLNFGHTVGHALEAATDHALSHGAAVALGMVLEARAARELCGLADMELARLEALLAVLDIVPPWPPLSFEQLLPHLGVDKKRREGQLRAALPLSIGSMAGEGEGYTVELPLSLLRRLWDNTRP